MKRRKSTPARVGAAKKGRRGSKAAPRRKQPSRRQAPVALPVRSLTAELPLLSLSYDRFQDFCAALLSAHYRIANVHQYGVAGDAQNGIDLDISFPDGSYYTAQCKKEKSFGPEKIRAAIKAHKIECDLAVILLARSATAAARDEIKKKRKKKWQLWDAKDIAEKLRGLARLDALRIIDTYFPAHRKDFLGVEHPMAFEHAEKYFAPMLRRDNIYSHAWKLVGREKQLRAVRKALKSESGVVVLAGAGGIGKSRLLRALVQQGPGSRPGRSAVILPSQATPSPSDYELVGSQETLVIIEDAHDRADMKSLLHNLVRLPSAPQLLITCRPYALTALLGEIEGAGMSVAKGTPITLSGLTVPEAEKIAKEILVARRGPVAAARHLALAAHDSPLALVVGSNLVAANRIHPSLLNNADAFQRALFTGFRDAITGQIGTEWDRPTIRSTLELVSVLQPLGADLAEFTGLAAALQANTIPESEISRSIQLLLESGVLVKKARKLKIVPDLLGDFVLESVLRRDATLAANVISKCNAGQFANFLINTAKIDRRREVGDDETKSLSQEGWRKLREVVRETRELPRHLRDAVTTAAFYQPQQALDLYDQVAALGPVDVELSRLLRHVAFNIGFTERACQRLWSLGKGDSRPQNAHPEHAARILKELAEIQPNKPIAFSERVAEFAMNLISTRREGDSDGDLYDVLNSVLSSDGHTTESTGLAFTIQRFTVRHDAVKKLRKRVNDFLLDIVSREDTRSAVRACASLSHGMRYPMNATEAARNAWGSEFIGTIRRLAELVKGGTLQPEVLVAIESAVHWHAAYNVGPVSVAARRLIREIPKDLRYRVTLAIADPWGHTRMNRGKGPWLQDWQDEVRVIARDLLAACGSAQAAVDVLRERSRAVQVSARSQTADPGQLASSVAEQDSAAAFVMCEAGLRDESMEPFFSYGIFAAMAADRDRALPLVEAAAASSRPSLNRHAAWALGARRRAGAATQQERNLLVGLTQNVNEYVVATAIRGIVEYADNDLRGVASVLLGIDLSRSRHVLSEFFSSVMNHPELREFFLTKEVSSQVLEALRRVPNLEDYWVESYLADVSAVAPVEIVRMILARVRMDSENGESSKIQPMPYLWDDPPKLKARESPEFLVALREIYAHLESKEESWRDSFWVPKLFVAIAKSVDSMVIEDVLGWMNENPERRFPTVTMLLRDVPPDFCLENVLLVERLFECADRLGQESVQALRSSLFAATVTGSKSGTAGQPFPEDVRRKTMSQEAVERLVPGSAVSEFYVALGRDAEKDIRDKAEQDRALLEEHS